MAKLARGCWIVVADAQGAMILENVGTVPEPDLRLIDRIDAPAITPHDDRPGRRSDGGPNQRSAMEVTDRARLSQVALSAMIVARLSREAARGMFHRLAIAAPPQLLGAIRDRLDDDLKRRLLVSVPKRLTGEPLGRIGSMMQDAMYRAA